MSYLGRVLCELNAQPMGGDEIKLPPNESISRPDLVIRFSNIIPLPSNILFLIINFFFF